MILLQYNEYLVSTEDIDDLMLEQEREDKVISNHSAEYAPVLLTQYYSISQEICTRFLLCCALLWLYIDWFSHIHQAYFTGTVAI